MRFCLYEYHQPMKLFATILVLLFLHVHEVLAQCCAGGSGSPVAGGTSQGVLSSGQMELNTNLQYINSDRFFTGDKRDTNRYFDRFRSIYQYFRLAYGVTGKFTMSIETGNYFLKEEIGLNNDPSKTYNSVGFSDLILFPRYNVYEHKTHTHTSEITLGLGYKIPVGSYNDSTGNLEPFSGQTYYVTNPQAVQLSSGAQDILFYAFLYRGYLQRDFRIFSNFIYIRKGWNPLGEKVGDFASLGLFAGKTFRDRYSLTLQLRGEWMDKMKLNEDILLYAYPNYDPEATGYRKIFFSPQISVTSGKFSIFALADIPVYQYVVNTQVGTRYQAVAGLSYRFNISRPEADDIQPGVYYCPMHHKVTSLVKGTCPDCGMDLIKK